MLSKEDYQKALDWLFVQMPNYQVDGQKAYKPGLDNIRKLCDFFGNPQKNLKMIHIAGTNGKGSTSNMLASVLQEQGYSVGLYNSPHLVDFTERIKVNGKNANQSFVYDFIQRLKTLPQDIRPSFFEFTTVMAFCYFLEQKVDFAIIEVGLGGRLDSTNIIMPMVCAITNIALDHQNILGNTIEEIAKEKAGIIKTEIPIVSGDENPAVKDIIQKMAAEKNARFIDASELKCDLETDLKGHCQKKNKRVVLGIVEVLRNQGVVISSDALEQGLQRVQQNTRFMGRWQKISDSPLLICDTAHNQAGLEQVFSQLEELPQYKHIVLGFVEDKKIDQVLRILPKNAQFYFVKPKINRGRHPKDYLNLLSEAGISFEILDSVAEGYQMAKEHCKDSEMIFVGGSNFVVGELLGILQ